MSRRMDWPATSVKMKHADWLKPYGSNARTHSPAQVAQIAASIEEWGFTNPILAQPDGTVIAGHGRLLAAQSLGLAEIPVMIATGWTQAQVRAYVLADNKLAENAGWDEDLLKIELGAIEAAGFDLGLVGFSKEELAAIQAVGDGGLTSPEATPEPAARAVTVLGDVWLLGGHRLVCGDSTDTAAVGACLGQETPAIANCDPPYGIRAVRGSTVGGAKPFGKVGGGMTRFGHEHGRSKNAIIKPNVYAEIIGDETTDTAIASYAVLKELGVPVIVLWGGNYYANALPPSQCWLVWDKETNGNFADAELAWTNQKRPVELLRHQWSGLIKASERGQKRVHPTQKPVALAKWVIETLAPEAESVLDLFLGSGSTLIACEELGKRCLAMELAPLYVDVAIKRWQNFTGKTATLQGTGQTFEDVADERYDFRKDGFASWELWCVEKNKSLAAVE